MRLHLDSEKHKSKQMNFGKGEYETSEWNDLKSKKSFTFSNRFRNELDKEYSLDSRNNEGGRINSYYSCTWVIDDTKLIIKKLDFNAYDFLRDFGGISSGVYAILSALAILPTRFSYFKSILNALFMVKKKNKDTRTYIKES